MEEEGMGNKGKPRYTLWIVAALYMLYLSYSILKGYLAGEDGAGIWILPVVAVFVLASLYLLFISYRGLKRIKEEENEQAAMEEAASAEPQSEPELRKPMSISERAHMVVADEEEVFVEEVTEEEKAEELS